MRIGEPFFCALKSSVTFLQELMKIVWFIAWYNKDAALQESARLTSRLSSSRTLKKKIFKRIGYN